MSIHLQWIYYLLSSTCPYTYNGYTTSYLAAVDGEMARAKIEVDISVLDQRSRTMHVVVRSTTTCAEVVHKALQKCRVEDPPIKYQLWMVAKDGSKGGPLVGVGKRGKGEGRRRSSGGEVEDCCCFVQQSNF